MKNTTSIKVPKKYQHMVDDIYHDSEKGYWCHSENGYYFSEVDYGIHIIREDTQKLLLEMIRSLRPCECKDCIRSDEQSESEKR